MGLSCYIFQNHRSTIPPVSYTHLDVYKRQTYVRVTLKEFSTFTVELFTLSGQLLHQKKFENYPSWDVPISTVDIPPGTYLIRVKTKDETVTQRLVVIR